MQTRLLTLRPCMKERTAQSSCRLGSSHGMSVVQFCWAFKSLESIRSYSHGGISQNEAWWSEFSSCPRLAGPIAGAVHLDLGISQARKWNAGDLIVRQSHMGSYKAMSNSREDRQYTKQNELWLLKTGVCAQALSPTPRTLTRKLSTQELPTTSLEPN